MTDVNFDKLKVIFIDWYLTLTSVTFLNKLKVEDYAQFRKFIEIIFENNSEGWQYDWARGKINKEDVAKKISEAGIMPYDKVLQTFAICCSHQSLDYPETLQIINALRKKGIKVVLATDNWDIFTEYTIPSLQLNRYFDDVLSSNQIGFLKRDIKNNYIPFFEDYMKQKQIDKNSVILIDDAQTNIEACQKSKIPAIKIQNCSDTLNILNKILEQKCKKN